MSAQTADVIVIGGGIVGAAAAHYIASSGRRVVVLEAGAPNRQGSGTTAGNLHIQALHTRRPGQAVPLDNRRFLPWQVAGSALWASIEDELGTSLEVRRHGGFMVAENEEQVEELTDKAVLEREMGLSTELVSGDEARRALPLLSASVVGATWCSSDGYANPLLAAPELLRSAQRSGASVHAFSPVRSIRRVQDEWQVGTDHGSWTAPWVINAAGPWIPHIARLAGVELDMWSGAAQMHVTVRMPPVMHHLVQHVSEGLSVKQVTAGNVLIGGGWPAASTNLGGRSETSVKSMRGNISQACRILPFLQNSRLLRVWAGPYVTTPDEMPVIGELPGAPGFLVAGGTYAFTLGLLWGVCLRALTEGRPPPVEITDIGPGRLTSVSP